MTSLCNRWKITPCCMGQLGLTHCYTSVLVTTSVCVSCKVLYPSLRQVTAGVYGEGLRRGDSYSPSSNLRFIYPKLVHPGAMFCYIVILTTFFPTAFVSNFAYWPGFDLVVHWTSILSCSLSGLLTDSALLVTKSPTSLLLRPTSD